MRPRTVFKGTTGLNNKIDPVRLGADYRTGLRELSEAQNIDIDSTGRPSRRPGYSQASAKPAHSLFPVGDYCLFVTGDALSVLETDWTDAPIRNVTVGARMSYVQVDDKAYYCNGYENGYVENRASHPWTAQDYVGPATTKTFSDPPLGHLLAIYNGRMYIAADSILWYSEPFAYSWYNKAANYIPFADRILMVRSVASGMYVSTKTKTYYLSGDQPLEFNITEVADYPAKIGSDCMVQGSRIHGLDYPGSVAMWTSTHGICVGSVNGHFMNLTEEKLVLPNTNQGAGFYFDGKYLCALKP